MKGKSWRNGMKIGAIALVVLLLVHGVYGVTGLDGIKRLDRKEETPLYKVKDEKIMNELVVIMNKEVLQEKDYARIRSLLEKMENVTIDDETWLAMKDYIDDERAKKKWFLEQKKSRQDENISILSTNPYDHVPILVQQYPDLFGGFLYEGRNYADEVFYKSNGLKNIGGIMTYEFEYTAVYRDEDAPWPYDGTYDAIRYANWGRYEDIETYYLYVYQNGTPWRFYFYYGSPVNSGIYSRSATYYTIPGHHYADYVSWSSFSKNGNRPYIWVNTWNHALGERDNNPALSDWTASYTITQGSRVNAEVKYVDDCSKSPFC